MIQDAISTSVGLVYIIPVILFFYTNDPVHLKALFGPLLGVTNEIIKHSIGKYSTRPECKRPEGAMDCNMWCNNGDQSGKPGMPSGHSLTACFFSGFYFQQMDNIWIKLMLIVYAWLIMASRYIKKCHTIPQIMIGGLIGLFFSVIIF
jgi:membrane-associated phospholipid phosphatase